MAKRLFVGGLPFSTTEDQLSELFSQAGSVSSCKIITDRYSGRSKGFGFVEFQSDEEADKAIEMFNGHEIDGRKLAVDVARPMREEGQGSFQSGGRGRGGWDRGRSRGDR